MKLIEILSFTFDTDDTLASVGFVDITLTILVPKTGDRCLSSRFFAIMSETKMKLHVCLRLEWWV